MNKEQVIKRLQDQACCIPGDPGCPDDVSLLAAIDMLKATTAKELINEIAPQHTRTSCGDNPDVDRKNDVTNSSGYYRCVRCALLGRAENGRWSYGLVSEFIDLRGLE